MRRNLITAFILMIFLFTILSLNVYANSEEKTKNLNPTITVKGGFGIEIYVFGVEDETSISVNLEGAYL